MVSPGEVTANPSPSISSQSPAPGATGESQTEPEMCSICHGNRLRLEAVVNCPGRHRFDMECISTACANDSRCPLCMQNITSIEFAGETYPIERVRQRTQPIHQLPHRIPSPSPRVRRVPSPPPPFRRRSPPSSASDSDPDWLPGVPEGWPSDGGEEGEGASSPELSLTALDIGRRRRRRSTAPVVSAPVVAATSALTLPEPSQEASLAYEAIQTRLELIYDSLSSIVRGLRTDPLRAFGEVKVEADDFPRITSMDALMRLCKRKASVSHPNSTMVCL
jgi:hypothetical protein